MIFSCMWNGAYIFHIINMLCKPCFVYHMKVAYMHLKCQICEAYHGLSSGSGWAGESWGVGRPGGLVVSMLSRWLPKV